ncbi:MAG: hypothetical protein M1835_005075 [Candelina submexicana]|nr:MAG: hypothetical protein M1835_005075 [Candelina submexicana]
MAALIILVTTFVCSCVFLLKLLPVFRCWVNLRKQPKSTIDSLGLVEPEQTVIYQDLKTCEMIASDDMKLNGSGIFGPLEARAAPNQRLVRTFNIDNAFTTIDPDYWLQFRRKSANLLSKNDMQWRVFSGTNLEIVRGIISGYIWSGGVDIVNLVQTLVLKFAIHILFDVQPTPSNDRAILVIAQKINELWLASKSHSPASSITKDQRELFSELQTVIRFDENNPRENPLNLILPAYETMWRIVLRCFLEVRFRNEELSPGYFDAFSAFLKDPTLSSFKKRSGTNSISVEHIVNESLRLYPPTRRIYRQKNRSSTVAADIEFLHRDPTIWGEDALRFRPARWGSTSEDALKAFMPFGGPRRFTCPSKGNAGPRMIGLLVAVLLEVFSSEYHWEAGSPEDKIDGDEPLSLERDRYSTLKLAPKTLPPAAKQALILTWFQKSGTAHSIKDLEKALPSIASINGMQVKDYLQALTDEGKIRVEKIGSGNWYWSFLSEEKKAKEDVLQKLREERDRAVASVQELQARIEEEGKAREDEGYDRVQMMKSLATLQREVECRKKELEGFSGNDPLEVVGKREETAGLRGMADRWTDNILVLEQYLLQVTGGDKVVLDQYRELHYGSELVDGELRELW